MTLNLYTYLFFLLIMVKISISSRGGLAMQSDLDNPATLSTSSMAMMRRCSEDDSRWCTVSDSGMRAQSEDTCKEY